MHDDYLRGLQTIAIEYGVKLLRGHTFREDMGGMPDILVGMHQKPMNTFAYDWYLYGKMARGSKEVSMFLDSTQQYWTIRNSHVQRVSDSALGHYEYLKANIYQNRS